MIPTAHGRPIHLFEAPCMSTASRTNPSLKLRRTNGRQKIASIKNHLRTPKSRIVTHPLLFIGRGQFEVAPTKQIRNTEDMAETPKSKKEEEKRRTAAFLIPKRDVIPLADDQMQFVVDDEPVPFGERIVALGQNVKKPVTFLGRAFVGGVRVVRHLESLPCGGVVAVGLSNSMTGFYDIPDRTSPSLFEQPDPTHTPATFSRNN